MPFVTTFLGGSNNSQALAIQNGNGSSTPDTGNAFSPSQTLQFPNCWGLSTSISSDAPSNLDSITLSPGTYCITGIVFSTYAVNLITYLSTSSASSTNGWVVKSVTSDSGGTGGIQFITAVVRVTSTQTIYLNAMLSVGGVGLSQGTLLATQIQ